LPCSTLHEIAGTDGDDCANRTPIAGVAFEIHNQEVLSVATIVAKYRQRSVQVVDDHIKIAVIVEIDCGGATADSAGGQRGA